MEQEIIDKNNNMPWIRNYYWKLEQYSCVLSFKKSNMVSKKYLRLRRIVVDCFERTRIRL